MAEVSPSAFENNYDTANGDATNYWLGDSPLGNFNKRDSLEFTEGNIWPSGPIIKDKAFFYVLLNPRTTNDTWASNTVFRDRETTSDRYFVNIDWELTDNHTVGVTIFNTESESITKNYEYNSLIDSRMRDDGKGNLVADENNPTQLASNKFSNGQDFIGATYDGAITNRLSVSAVVGVTKQEDIPTPGSDEPSVCNAILFDNCNVYSAHTNATITYNKFERTHYRLDFNLDANNHQVAFGIDAYKTNVSIQQEPNGRSVAGDDLVGLDGGVSAESDAGWWRIGTSGNQYEFGDEALNSGITEGTNFVQRRIRTRYTDSTVSSTAFYISDSWQVSDAFTLNYGLRHTDLENTITTGEAYADLSGNLAPRLGAIWDIGGEGKRKVFATWGRYFQPVASRMNFTQGSQSVEYYDFYEYLGNTDSNGNPILTADGSPERGAPMNQVNNAPGNPENRYYTQVGTTDPGLIASKNLEAMYSDQFTMGYSSEISDSLTGEIRFTYNEMKVSVEDTDYALIIAQVLAAQGIQDNTGQGSYYILANPGDSVVLDYDFNGDGTRDQVELTPADLQLEKATRKYQAWDFILSGQASDRLSFHASYTWSHSYGNTEGLVKTTNGQADPGWTNDYDSGEFLDYATGLLPNDRRHSIKVSGLYDLSDKLALGLIYRGAAGSPWAGCPGGSNESFYDPNGQPAPRGSAGNLPWQSNFDLSLTYTNDSILSGLTLKATVYNLFNAQTATRIQERSGPNYGLPNDYQAPRFVSLIARLEF